MKNSLFFNLSYDISNARRIRENPERREKSIRFAISAIICSVLAIPFSALIFLFVNSLKSNNMILIIFGIILGLCLGVGGTLSLLIQAIKSFFLQLYINKKPITWVSLSILIISIISCLIIIVYTLSKNG